MIDTLDIAKCLMKGGTPKGKAEVIAHNLGAK